MKTHSLWSLFGLSCALTAFLSLAALAAPYAAGDKMVPFTSKDQHDKPFTLTPSQTRFLLVSHDMETGKQANAILTTVGPDNLRRDQVIYLANIHGMPGIGRMFALPKMRKYSHSIILGDDPSLMEKFPEQKGKVTVLRLQADQVKEIRYWAPGMEPLSDFLK
jgi:hypothetical protein